MNATKKSRPAKSQKTTVRKLLTAVDRLILAAKDAERARDELARNAEGCRK